HAAFWQAGPPGADARCLVSWTDPALGAMLTQLVTSGVAALCRRYTGRVPAAILAIADAAPNWAGVLRRCAEDPQTFVHNDFRLDNIFFQPDGEPVVIDWRPAACSLPSRGPALGQRTPVELRSSPLQGMTGRQEEHVRFRPISARRVRES